MWEFVHGLGWAVIRIRWESDCEEEKSAKKLFGLCTIRAAKARLGHQTGFSNKSRLLLALMSRSEARTSLLFLSHS